MRQQLLQQRRAVDGGRRSPGPPRLRRPRPGRPRPGRPGAPSTAGSASSRRSPAAASMHGVEQQPGPQRRLVALRPRGAPVRAASASPGLPAGRPGRAAGGAPSPGPRPASAARAPASAVAARAASSSCLALRALGGPRLAELAPQRRRSRPCTPRPARGARPGASRSGLLGVGEPSAQPLDLGGVPRPSARPGLAVARTRVGEQRPPSPRAGSARPARPAPRARRRRGARRARRTPAARRPGCRPARGTRRRRRAPRRSRCRRAGRGGPARSGDPAQRRRQPDHVGQHVGGQRHDARRTARAAPIGGRPARPSRQPPPAVDGRRASTTSIASARPHQRQVTARRSVDLGLLDPVLPARSKCQNSWSAGARHVEAGEVAAAGAAPAVAASGITVLTGLLAGRVESRPQPSPRGVRPDCRCPPLASTT